MSWWKIRSLQTQMIQVRGFITPGYLARQLPLLAHILMEAGPLQIQE